MWMRPAHPDDAGACSCSIPEDGNHDTGAATRRMRALWLLGSMAMTSPLAGAHVPCDPPAPARCERA